MTVPWFHVDAFADRPFAGNPAAVLLLPAPATEDWMRSVARASAQTARTSRRAFDMAADSYHAAGR